MLKVVQIIKKITLTCLCSLLLVTQVISPKSVQAVSTSDDEFQLFLADVLVDNYLLKNVNQMMLHQYFYEYLKQQNGAVNLAVTLTNMANDWGYAINGKTDLYEDILVELIHDYINSDLFLDEAKQSRERVEQELFSFLKDAIDFNQLKDDHIELAEKINKMDSTSWECILDLPYQYIDDYVEGIADRFELPVSSSYLLNLSTNTVDFLYEIVMYQSFRDSYDQIYQVLDIMYRQTLNSELRIALKRVLDKLKAADHPQLWKIVEESKDEFLVDANMTTSKELLMSALTFVGLGIDTGGFISEVFFKSSTLSECQLLLEAELDIENAIKEAIYYKQNNYHANVGNATIFNGAMMLLYNAYDYGLEICEDYNEAVFEVAKHVYIENPKEFMSKYEQKTKDIEFTNSKHDYEKFNNAIKLWQSIADNDRTVFNTAWDLYRTDHDRIVRDFLEDFLGKTYIQDISFAQSHIILDMKDYNGSTFLTKVNINLTEDSGTMITYTSSDPTILEIVNENMYRVNLLKEGTVTVTASTLDKLHTVTQQVTIIDTTQSQEELYNANKEDYSDYYIENETGITLTGYILECIEYSDWALVFNNYVEVVYNIPAKVNGKTVTEIDFSSKKNLVKIGSREVAIDEYIMPSTIKKIAPNCFKSKGLRITLNEGLEEIGESAFEETNFKNLYNDYELILPSTLKTIGEKAFKSTIGLKTVTINTSLLTEIPDYCFNHATIGNIIFTQERANLKTIGKHAFSGSILTKRMTSINLPDSIEVIEEYAFDDCVNLTLTKLPNNLKEIHTSALDGVNLDLQYMPSGLEIMKDYAFDSKHSNMIYIPNSVKEIGKGVLNYTKTYGDNNNNEGIIPDYYLGYPKYFEIPSSIKKVGVIGNPNSLTSGTPNYTDINFSDVELVWTSNIDEITCATNNRTTGRGSRLYLNEGPSNGKYQLSGHIFSENEYYDYIEIPTNYLNNTTNVLTDKYLEKWMKDVVIVNVGTEVDLDRYVEILYRTIDEGGSISYKDEEGNITLLFERPISSYTKVSNYLYEKHVDYQVEGISLFNNKIQDDVVNKNNLLKLDVTISYDNETKSTLGSNPTLKIKCWEDNPSESKSQRAAQLGAYLNFEDLYLKQNDYRYFNLYFDNVDVNQKGSYVIQLNVNNTSYTKDKTALYKIEGSKITRIPIQIASSGIITFETDTLGLFALAPFNKLEEKAFYYLEELHNLLDGQEIKVWYENSVTYETQKGTITITGEDKNEEDSSVIVSKPEIREEVKKEIIKNFEMDDTLIDEEINETVINEESLESKKLWDAIENSLIKIDTTQDNETIQIAITQLLEKYNALHLFKVVEVDGKLTLVDITKDAIHQQNDKQVSELIMSNNRDYFECTLDESGTYYFALTESDTKIDYGKVSSLALPLILGGIGVASVGALILFLINKKKKMNKYKEEED